MNEEPTVLDFVKALLTPWKGPPPPIAPIDASSDEQLTTAPFPQPEDAEEVNKDQIEQTIPDSAPTAKIISFPWIAAVALGLALFAQISLEPGEGRSWTYGLALYILAAIWALLATWRGDWNLPELPRVRQLSDPFMIRQTFLWIGVAMTILALLTLGGNRFTIGNTLLWLGGITCTILAFWLPKSKSSPGFWDRLGRIFSRRDWDIKVSRWTIVIIAATALILFFRVYRLGSVPPEMVSDHAEKLLDVWDVLQGELRIFFPRNTGREGLQMYLTAAVSVIFGTGISFNSLKIGTVIAGLVTLPFVYLLGVELGNKRVGMLAMVFAGIAYWPNVISRVALRFTLYPLFVAPTLYFLIRGLRRSSRNDFILAGLFLGIGLHGYTAFRIVPIVVLMAVGLYLLHPQSKGYRKRTLLYLGLLILVALIIFLPLLRFWIENPEPFNFRVLTRVTSAESPLQGPAWEIFKDNLRDALTMFAWSNGEIWPVSIPYRPALGVVSASFFYMGVVLLIFRNIRKWNWKDLLVLGFILLMIRFIFNWNLEDLFYLGILLLLIRNIRKWNWEDLLILLSIPLLLLPSILSLAFPSENPTLNRTAGALVPVFLIIGLSMDGLMESISASIGAPNGRRLAWGTVIVLLLWSGFQNYDLVFTQYANSYSMSSWNTSEIGSEIKDFTDTIGREETAFVVAYPHWVDTRLVGINAGFPTRDFAIWPENFETTTDLEGTKLFIIKSDDRDSISALQSIYPDGLLQWVESKVPDKDFYKFYVLAQ